MSAGEHNLPSQIASTAADFGTTGKAFWTPEGFIIGWGTTVGNGVENWAPGAMFTDTNAAAGSQFFINEGTATTAAFKAVPNLATAQAFTAAQTFTGGTRTAAVVVGNADQTILAADSGKIHLVANVSADRTFTLPTAAAGLYYEFWSTVVAADDFDWLIVTGSDTNFYLGGLIHHDVGQADGIPILAAPNGTDDATLQVILPTAGCLIKMYCDGTNWFLNGVVFSVTIPSYT